MCCFIFQNPRANYGGYVFEHILVYETYHKCCLLSWIILHHKDGDKQNNNISNLIPMTRGAHKILHNMKPTLRFTDKCPNCNSDHIKRNGMKGVKRDRQAFLCSDCRERWCVMLECMPSDMLKR